MNRELILNKDEKQFEFHLGDEIAFIEYINQADSIYLIHTEVPKSLSGQGIGQELVKKVLEHIKQSKQSLMPTCSFVAWYVDNHPEWHSILSEGYQM